MSASASGNDLPGHVTTTRWQSAEDQAYFESMSEKDLVRMTKALVGEVERRGVAQIDGCPQWMPDSRVDFWRLSVYLENEEVYSKENKADVL
ncbi:hypothetical protein LTR65_002651 [Meristemomyces frigidus]